MKKFLFMVLVPFTLIHTVMADSVAVTCNLATKAGDMTDCVCPHGFVLTGIQQLTSAIHGTPGAMYNVNEIYCRSLTELEQNNNSKLD